MDPQAIKRHDEYNVNVILVLKVARIFRMKQNTSGER